MTAPRAAYSIVTQRLALPRLAFTAGLLLVQPSAATPFQRDYTGSINVGRYYHAATLLAYDKVLVTSGSTTGNEVLASAELFDPATGYWTNTRSIVNARYDHTAHCFPSIQRV